MGNQWLTSEQRTKLVEFIRQHREAVETDQECVFAAIDHFQLPVKKVKSAVSRYIKLAFPHRYLLDGAAKNGGDEEPSAMFRRGENLIREALKNIDAERNRHVNAIKDLDNLAAKYKGIL